MKSVRVSMLFRVVTAGDLDAHTDRVMDELVKLEDETLFDADLNAVLSTGSVEISIIGVGVDFDAAVDRAHSAIRTAIHAAGGSQNLEAGDASFEKQNEHADLVSV